MYSQREEETHILQICKGVTGQFLDVGAWHAKTFSNTRALFELGWGGILIEPSPGPAKELVREYGNCDRMQVISAAMTVEGGLIELEVTDDALSQPPGERAEGWRSAAGFLGKLTVPAISVLEFFAGFGGDFEMISIDTEGTSVDIFAEILRVGPRPRCIVVEHDSRFVELSGHAEKANYRMVHENGENRVYEWTGRRE